jgi:hypothetical protein
MMNVLRPLTEWLPFRLVRQEKLPSTEAIMDELDAFLIKGSQAQSVAAKKRTRRTRSATPPTSDNSALP